MRPENTGTHRLFTNPILEKLTRTHIAVPVTIFIVYAFVLCLWSVNYTSLTPGITLILFFLGWLAFTWVEYQVHRHIFHLPTYTEWRKNFQYIVDGVDHHYLVIMYLRFYRDFW